MQDPQNYKENEPFIDDNLLFYRNIQSLQAMYDENSQAFLKTRSTTNENQALKKETNYIDT